MEEWLGGWGSLANYDLSRSADNVSLFRMSGLDGPRDASPATLAVLGEKMRWRLYALIRAAHRPVSREEAATSVGISRKLAAFHLDKLVSAGLLRARYDVPVRGRRVGRMPKTYEPSGAEVAISIPARRHDALAGILIAAIRAGISGENPLAAATRIARLKGAEYGASQRERLRLGRIGAERALTLLAEILDELGYEPQRVSPTELRLHNCPFHPLSACAPDVVCAANQAGLCGLLEGLDAPTVKMIPERGTCCVMFTGT
jgi:predicted ArsR family transcriptional regulator